MDARVLTWSGWQPYTPLCILQVISAPFISMSMPGKIIVQLENSDRRRVECMHVKYEWLLPRNTVNAEAADSRLQNMWLEKAECIRSLALNDICFYSSIQASGSWSGICVLFVVHFLGERLGSRRYWKTGLVSHGGTQPLLRVTQITTMVTEYVCNYSGLCGISLSVHIFPTAVCHGHTHTRPIQKEALGVSPQDWKSFICSALVVKYFIYKTEMQAKFKGDNSYVGDFEDNVLCTTIFKQGVFSQGVPQRYL